MLFEANQYKGNQPFQKKKEEKRLSSSKDTRARNVLTVWFTIAGWAALLAPESKGDRAGETRFRSVYKRYKDLGDSEVTSNLPKRPKLET